MEVKKCARCGSFLTSYDNICIPCGNKDKADIQNLKSFFEDNSNTYSVKELSFNTGITEKNLTRYLENDDFTPYIGNDNQDVNNVSINL